MDAGALLREARVSRGLTQHDLAVRAGTTQSAISRLEHGGISPTIEALDRLMRCLGLHVTLAVEPFPTWTDDTDLVAAAQQTPDERLDHAVTGLRSLSRLLGTAHRA